MKRGEPSKGYHSPRPTGGPVPSRAPSSGHPGSQLFSFFLHPIYTAEHDITWHGTSLWSAWVGCPSCVPSQPLAYPQPTCWGVKNRESLDAVQACSAIDKTLMHYQHCFSTNPNHSTICAAMKKVNSVTGRGKAAYCSPGFHLYHSTKCLVLTKQMTAASAGSGEAGFT